jgi:hypothetical protein
MNMYVLITVAMIVLLRDFQPCEVIFMILCAYFPVAVRSEAWALSAGTLGRGFEFRSGYGS